MQRDSNTEPNELHAQERFIPAMGHRALTPIYDLFVRTFLRERAIRHRLIDLLAIGEGMRVLDVGSGTGTLLRMAKEQHPNAELVGIDGDPQIVVRARSKAERAGQHVQFRVALATALPCADQSVDRVTSTFVMHHLTLPAKARTCAEMFRVLRAGGQAVVVDFGPPLGRIGRVLSCPLRGMGEMADNLDGKLPGILVDAGFARVHEAERIVTPFGPVMYLSGIRPE